MAGIHELQSIIKNMGGKVPGHLTFGIAESNDNKGISLKKVNE